MKETEKEELDLILSRHERNKNELISVLQEAQEKFGYLPRDVMAEIASYLRVPASTVYGVATFYAQFRFIPSGKRIVKVCRGTACHVRGSPRILDQVEKRLKIKPGETTEDLEYSLESIACFGSCALGPVMVLNNTVYGRMTPKKVDEILNIKR